MKLQQTQDYLLLIDEEASIKDHKWVHEGNKIIAYYPLTKEAKELDLPILPVTPKDKWGVHETHCCEKHGCKYGDNDCCVAIGIAKAKYSCEYCDYDENDKQFSLEDIKKALHFGEALSRYFGTHKAKERESFIQSLSTQQLPKEFIPEYKKVHKKNSDGEDIGFPVHDSDELKTITNSEGKQELVGIYRY